MTTNPPRDDAPERIWVDRNMRACEIKHSFKAIEYRRADTPARVAHPLVWNDDNPFHDDEPDSIIYSEAIGAGYTYIAEAVDCTLDEAKAEQEALWQSRILAALLPTEAGAVQRIDGCDELIARLKGNVPSPAAPTDAALVAWEATTPAYKQFVTDEQYRKFSDEARRWYKPYRCSTCAALASRAAPPEAQVTVAADRFGIVIEHDARGWTIWRKYNRDYREQLARCPNPDAANQIATALRALAGEGEP